MARRAKAVIFLSFDKCCEVSLKEGPLYRRHPYSFRHKARYFCVCVLLKLSNKIVFDFRLFLHASYQIVLDGT